MDEYRLRNLIDYWSKGGVSGNVNANSAIVQSLQRQLDDVLAQKNYIPSERYISNENLSDISRYSRPYQIGMDGWQDWRNYTPPAQPVATNTVDTSGDIPREKSPIERRPEDYDSYANGVIKDEPINVYTPSAGEPTYNYAYSQPPASGEIDYEDPNYSEILDAANGKKGAINVKQALPNMTKTAGATTNDDIFNNITPSTNLEELDDSTLQFLAEFKYDSLFDPRARYGLRAKEILEERYPSIPDKTPTTTKFHVPEKGKVIKKEPLKPLGKGLDLAHRKTFFGAE